jgi:hypothetical protein
MSFVLYIHRKNCIVTLIADLHTLKAVLPFFIKMSMNFYFSFAFHIIID